MKKLTQQSYTMRLDGLEVGMSPSHAVGHGFESMPGHTNDPQ